MDIGNSEFEHRSNGHKVCFLCRKRMDSKFCQCGNESINFGKYFEVPSYDDIKSWVLIELAYDYTTFKHARKVNDFNELNEILIKENYIKTKQDQKEFDKKKQEIMERHQKKQN